MVRESWGSIQHVVKAEKVGIEVAGHSTIAIAINHKRDNKSNSETEVVFSVAAARLLAHQLIDALAEV